MNNMPKKTTPIVDGLVQEGLRLLEADPEFIDLCNLVPKALVGKESGKDFLAVTTDHEYFERTKNEKVIVLSKHD